MLDQGFGVKWLGGIWESWKDGLLVACEKAREQDGPMLNESARECSSECFWLGPENQMAETLTS